MHSTKLAPQEIDSRLTSLPPWRSVDYHHLQVRYDFDDFAQALAFTNRVGALAEEQQHHPDILLSWGKVEIRLWTHSANGLTTKDFDLAAAIDKASVGTIRKNPETSIQKPSLES